MRVAHLLRKYNPAEWGGTETALQCLVTGLRRHDVESVLYCPDLQAKAAEADPLAAAGASVKRFKAILPVWGLSAEERQTRIAVGGNLLSFDLARLMWREPGLSLIHTHTLGRLGAIARVVARRRHIPLVITVHGGVLALPEALRKGLNQRPSDGWEWGRLFGLLLRSRWLLTDAEVILTCNPEEAALLRRRYPRKRILVQPHGVPVTCYQNDCRGHAREAFPQIDGAQVLLCPGRLDPVKNQRWLIEEAPHLFHRHPRTMLVLAGAATDSGYEEQLRLRIRQLDLGRRVLLTGGLPPQDLRLIGLFQLAEAVLLPSISETFGMVILEAWAAGTATIANRTSGACALIEDGRNGLLFDLAQPRGFHAAVDLVLREEARRKELAAAGHLLVRRAYDDRVLTGQMKELYEQLTERTHALRDPARR